MRRSSWASSWPRGRVCAASSPGRRLFVGLLRCNWKPQVDCQAVPLRPRAAAGGEAPQFLIDGHGVVVHRHGQHNHGSYRLPRLPPAAGNQHEAEDEQHGQGQRRSVWR